MDDVVYVAIQHSPNYELTETKILGMFRQRIEAETFIIRYAMSLLDFNYYDPAKRFYEREDFSWRARQEQVRIVDNWEGTIGISEYRVEPRTIGEEFTGETPPGTTYFAFDKYIKARISDESIDRETVRSLLLNWKNDDTSRGMLRELMQTKDKFKSRPTYKQWTANDWIQLHGSIKPYPWNENGLGIEKLETS